MARSSKRSTTSSSTMPVVIKNVASFSAILCLSLSRLPVSTPPACRSRTPRCPPKVHHLQRRRLLLLHRPGRETLSEHPLVLRQRKEPTLDHATVVLPAMKRVRRDRRRLHPGKLHEQRVTNRVQLLGTLLGTLVDDVMREDVAERRTRRGYPPSPPLFLEPPRTRTFENANTLCGGSSSGSASGGTSYVYLRSPRSLETSARGVASAAAIGAHPRWYPFNPAIAFAATDSPSSYSIHAQPRHSPAPSSSHRNALSAPKDVTISRRSSFVSDLGERRR